MMRWLALSLYAMCTSEKTLTQIIKNKSCPKIKKVLIYEDLQKTSNTFVRLECPVVVTYPGFGKPAMQNVEFECRPNEYLDQMH